ncbi:MAG: hypothetical protein Q9168_006395, partial [Polycauliona sp. 1 TL-2023]
MNQDIPFEEYMPGLSPRPASSTVQETSPSPSETFIPAYQHHSDALSSCPDSPSSSPSLSDPHHPSQEVSPFEQEVIDLYKMARLDDGSDLESDCGDEYDGGVSLVGHEDVMDVDGIASEFYSTQGSLTASGSMPSTAALATPLPQAPAQAWPHHLEDSTESTAWAYSSQPIVASSLDGLDPPTSEPNTQIPMPQTPNPSHEFAFFNTSPSTDWLFDYHPLYPDQDSSLDLDQPASATTPTVSEALIDYNGYLIQPSAQPYPQMYDGPVVTMDGQYYEEQKNFSLIECLEYCAEGREEQDANPRSVGPVGKFPRITNHNIEIGKRKRKEDIVENEDVETGRYDCQGIDWQAFGTPRTTTRRMRKETYVNHTNLPVEYCLFRHWRMYASAQYVKLDAGKNANPIANTEKYFNFSRMDLQHQICIPHFQLRHTISASSKNAIFFPTVVKEDGIGTTGSQITNFNPDVADDSYVIDSAHVDRNLDDQPEMNKIYALSAKNDVLVAGGLAGEYAYKSLSSNRSAPFTSGMITHSDLSSTNHVHTYLSRHSGLPQAVFSSNDSHIHTLDLTTNKFISRHDHTRYVNCSATSPDTRLRVLVRDATHPLIIEADTGKRIGKLTGHKDWGFACDWAADGRYFATGAQDGLVQIFDMRNWRHPVTTLLTELGGVRSLAFSPGGTTGRPVLLMAESADFVHVVDASDGMFAKKQTVDFF